MKSGSFLAIGLALGVGIGVALDQLAVGIAIGLSMGIALDSSRKRKAPEKKDEQDEPGED